MSTQQKQPHRRRLPFYEDIEKYNDVETKLVLENYNKVHIKRQIAAEHRILAKNPLATSQRIVSVLETQLAARAKKLERARSIMERRAILQQQARDTLEALIGDQQQDEHIPFVSSSSSVSTLDSNDTFVAVVEPSSI